MFDSNIKVHFAGSDGEEIFYAALCAAKTRYRLYSCYKYIVNKSPDADFRLPANHVIKVQDRENRHVIQDSGLFTLMFGKGKDQRQTRETLTQWQDKLIAFVEQNGITATCVEIDCQKVLGVEDAWYFRERMRRRLKNPQINVFHFEDGKCGLDRLIDFSSYIAISVPELRIIKPKTFREDTRYLTHYIKNRKPEIDIHLLGCTDVKMIAQNRFCTSADSTSWLAGVKFGYFDDGTQKAHIRHFRRDIFERRQAEVKAVIDSRAFRSGPRPLTTVPMPVSALLSANENMSGRQARRNRGFYNMKKNDRNLFILVTLFVISIVIANVTGARTITTGLSLGSIPLALSGGAITYAVTFLCTDIIGEIWGKDTAKGVVKYGFIGQVFATACIMITGAFPATDPVMDTAYQTLLGQNWIFVIGSLSAYLVSQTWDVLVFHFIRGRYVKRHGSTKGGRWLWNNGSTLTSQIWDTVIYATISFGLGLGWLFTAEGRMQLMGIIIGQYLLKAGLALLDTPFFYFFTRNADKR